MYAPGKDKSVVWTYIQNNLLDLLFTIVTFILGCLYRDVRKRLMEEKTKSDAIAEGVQSLLRENIVANFNKYHQDRKHCPIYAKESLKRVYDAYHNLGGNDVATALYEKVLNMPEEPETTEKERLDENDE